MAASKVTVILTVEAVSTCSEIDALPQSEFHQFQFVVPASAKLNLKLETLSKQVDNNAKLGQQPVSGAPIVSSQTTVARNATVLKDKATKDDRLAAKIVRPDLIYKAISDVVERESNVSKRANDSSCLKESKESRVLGEIMALSGDMARTDDLYDVCGQTESLVRSDGKETDSVNGACDRLKHNSHSKTAKPKYDNKRVESIDIPKDSSIWSKKKRSTSPSSPTKKRKGSHVSPVRSAHKIGSTTGATSSSSKPPSSSHNSHKQMSKNKHSHPLSIQRSNAKLRAMMISNSGTGTKLEKLKKLVLKKDPTAKGKWQPHLQSPDAGSRLASKNKMRDDMRREASAVGDFRCDICDKQCHSEHNLQYHRGLHQNRCTECRRRFKNAKMLAEHERSSLCQSIRKNGSPDAEKKDADK